MLCSNRRVFYSSRTSIQEQQRVLSKYVCICLSCLLLYLCTEHRTGERGGSDPPWRKSLKIPPYVTTYVCTSTYKSRLFFILIQYRPNTYIASLNRSLTQTLSAVSWVQDQSWFPLALLGLISRTENWPKYFEIGYAEVLVLLLLSTRLLLVITPFTFSRFHASGDFDVFIS